jgi:alanine dehydrogenase
MDKSKIAIPTGLISSHFSPKEQFLQVAPRRQKLFIGIPKENSFQENRIALTPASVKALVRAGHRIVVEAGAGELSRFTDFDYSEAGAEIAYETSEVLKAQVVLKVAPPNLEEIEMMQPNQILISPIHLPTMSDEYLYKLKSKRVTALAMEYMRDKSGAFPFVRMISEMAGISAMQIAADLLTKSGNGRGVLLGGIAGVPPSKVVILGAGVVSEVASRVALGYGAEVRVFDNSIRKLMRLQNNLATKLYTGTFNTPEFERELSDADVVIGAIHSETGQSLCVVSEDMVRQMKAGSVIIDVSIDQGGCFATSRITTHDKPTFRKYDVIHYCVPNIVSNVPRTASAAISNILVPFLLEANSTEGIELLIKQTQGFRNGIYLYKGSLTNKHLSERFNIKYTDINLLMMTDI